MSYQLLVEKENTVLAAAKKEEKAKKNPFSF